MLLVRDIPMASAITEMYGKNDRGGSMHLFDNAARFYGGNTIIAGNLNLAVYWQLPLLFICENDLYAMSTALKNSESEQDINSKAQSYQIRPSTKR